MAEGSYYFGLVMETCHLSVTHKARQETGNAHTDTQNNTLRDTSARERCYFSSKGREVIAKCLILMSLTYQ